MVGQEHVVRALTNALTSERLHHAYLFAGTRGVGKTTIARILAKSLNCEQGLTADPCGTCSACREIDEGRFVDLIEVDAASKTKVDDTRDLLDNVQFAPAGGRYKVYLIDEVHMLTRHSFNALLKTLEEPPPHIKFLLATTDPQKLPVTVLSRCLQFNLKRLTPRLIRDRLEFICNEESVPADAEALSHIARAADGSLRDALSLLDQAIAYCGGEVREAETVEMLGTVDRQQVMQILKLLADDDAAGLMSAIDSMDEQFPDYAQLLDDLARIVQRVAVLQVVGRTDHDDDLATGDLEELADSLDAEDLQLFYQIAITGRRDLRLAPDPRSGIEMTLLRMLAFRPDDPATERKPSSAPPSGRRPRRPDSTAPEAPRPAALGSPGPGPVADGAPAAGQPLDPAGWSALVEQLDIRGAVKLLASNCVLLDVEGSDVRLALDPAAESYLTTARQQALGAALSRHFDRNLKVVIEPAQGEVETPMREKARLENEDLQAARESLQADPNVRTLIDVFGATLNLESVRVVDKQ